MTAVLATFADFKTVKTRSTVQLVLEAPIEQADAILQALGGIPQPGKEQWVGIAPVKAEATQPKPEPARQRFADLPASQQAALKCADADFQRWLAEAFPAAWNAGRSAHPNSGTGAELTAAAVVRWKCGVASRGLLNTSEEAAGKWRALLSEYDDHLFQQRYAQ